MSASSDLPLLLFVWVAAAGIAVLARWRSGTAGAGLVLAYVVNLGIIHWLGAAIYVLPWYSSPSLPDVVNGFRESTYGIVAFSVGVVFVAPLLATILRLNVPTPVNTRPSASPDPRSLPIAIPAKAGMYGSLVRPGPLDFRSPIAVGDKFRGNLGDRPDILARTHNPWDVATAQRFVEIDAGLDSRLRRVPALWYMAIGLVFYLVLGPVLGRVPTLGAILSSGQGLLVVGLCLASWKALSTKKHRAFAGWLLASICLPLLTTIQQGFLGFGTMAALSVFSFLASSLRSKRKAVLIGLVLGYLGLSLYVSYMRDRDAIRATVWGGDTMETRLGQVYQTLSTLELFNPNDVSHLNRIDERLNQNILVGAAMDYLASGQQEFAGGNTIWQAIVGIIPRALWPDKQVVAGSMDLVSQYTGMQFAAGTSVGVGHVLEFYINFGTIGVVLGFLVLGAAVATIDRKAGEHLAHDDWAGFVVWFLPGLDFLNVGGSLFELTAGAGSALVTAILINRLLLHLLRPINRAAAREDAYSAFRPRGPQPEALDATRARYLPGHTTKLS